MPIVDQELLDKIDNFFKPDLQIMLDDGCIIIGCQALTTVGAFFLLNNNLLEKNYDEIEFFGLCVESMFKSEVERDTLDDEENQ